MKQYDFTPLVVVSRQNSGQTEFWQDTRYQMTGIIPDFLIFLSCVTSWIPSTSAVAPINRS